MGIFVMSGPGIKKDERIYGANVIDVTPTLLAATHERRQHTYPAHNIALIFTQFF